MKPIMTVGDVAEILYSRIPVEETYSKGEIYGFVGQEKDEQIQIKKVLYCVTPPTFSGIKYFKENNYDLLVAHHPFHLNQSIPTMVFHTALDCCYGGLNDQWKNFLQIKNAKHIDKNIGWYGDIDPKTLPELVLQIEQALGRKIQGQIFGSNTELITSVAVCSGLGGLIDDLTLNVGVDCYIVGEAVRPPSSVGFDFYIEVGHTISEQMGVNVIKESLEPHGIQVDLMPIEFESWPREVYQDFYGKFK